MCNIREEALGSESAVGLACHPSVPATDVAMRWLALALVTPLNHLTPLEIGPRAPPVIMGRKGDGKQRRPPQQRLGDLGPPAPPAPPAPAARIQSSSAPASHTLSVKKQIALIKSFERSQRQQNAAPKSRVAFRKKEKNNTRAGKGDDEIIDVGDVNWRELPTLFIDGYNIINAWPRLKKSFVRGELAICRERLLEDVATFTIKRYNTTVVFDANGAADNFGKDREDVYAGGLVRVVYASESADAYIEGETRRLRAEGVPVFAATSDGGVATACNVYGATVMSAKSLVSGLKASRKSQGALTAEFNRQQDLLAGRQATLWDALDPTLREELDGKIEQSAFNGLSRKQREAMEAIRENPAEERGAAARRRQQLEAQRLRRRAPGRNSGGAGAGGGGGDDAPKG